MVIGLIAGLATAVLWGVASVLQAIGARRVDQSEGLDPRFFVRIVKQLPFVLGMGMDAVGFAASLVAIALLPLFLAEALFASSIGVTAVCAVIFMKVKLSATEKVALIALMIGLALLAGTAEPGEGKPLPDAGKLILYAGIVLVLVLAGLVWKFGGERSGQALALVSGVSFTGMAVAARTLKYPDDFSDAISVLKEPQLYALVIFGVVGFGLFATALQRAQVTTVTALLFGTETVLPAALGIIFLGDTAREGLWAVAAIGFVTAVVCIVILSRQAVE